MSYKFLNKFIALRAAPSQFRKFSTFHPINKIKNSQDDFFKEDTSDIPILKVEKSIDDEQYNYDGRIADRVTEDDYTTENLMSVSLGLLRQRLSDFSLVRSKICRQSTCVC